MTWIRRGMGWALLTLAPASLGAQQLPPADVAAVDSLFAPWATTASPGCAVGVSRDGRVVLTRAYGMANLEYDVPNTPATIFEAGSVSKQFTAAAVALLAQDGKLSLEDPVRKFFPELPAYGDSITVRQMLNHTSGLRDWGNVAGIAGWPRGSRVHTHAHALDIIVRQKSLNFPPGSEYSYSNSNYNLAAMLVERVSGMSFAEFTRARIFQPLGMTRTSWRDDYTRIVKHRSTAYARAAGTAWRQDMPFENVHGNGGLLTTVEDLLTWNENFVTPRVGGARLASDLQTRGRLSNGRTISYALGLVVDAFRGVPEVNHTGATAGYRAYLGRFPNQRLGVAVLCNASDAAPSLGQRVAAILLKGQLQPAPAQAAAGVRLDRALLTAKAGTFRDERTGFPVRVSLRDSVLRFGTTVLTPTGPRTFTFQGTTLEFLDNDRRMRLVASNGDTVFFSRQPDWTPTAAELTQYAGRYWSEEAESEVIVAVKDGALSLADRYGRAVPLAPAYRDAFMRQGGTLVVFRRSAAGTVSGLTVGMERVREMRFVRRAGNE